MKMDVVLLPKQFGPFKHSSPHLSPRYQHGPVLCSHTHTHTLHMSHTHTHTRDYRKDS